MQSTFTEVLVMSDIQNRSKIWFLSEKFPVCNVGDKLKGNYRIVEVLLWRDNKES